MNELLRFTAPGQKGVLVFLPPKFEFVFYDQKMEMYKKGKLERTINYEDIQEVVVMKNWQNNVFINCKPIGVNIYKVSDEICNKIKEITSKKNQNRKDLRLNIEKTNILDGIGFDEKNSKLALLLADGMDWCDEYNHLMLLQEKINYYIAYIENKQYLKYLQENSIDLNKIKQIEIQIHFLFKETDNCKKFLKQVEQLISTSLENTSITIESDNK